MRTVSVRKWHCGNFELSSLLLGLAIAGITSIVILIDWQINVSRNVRWLFFPSAFLFAVLYPCLFIESLRPLIFPVMLIAIPGPLDDVFPKVFIGSPTEINAAPVAVISYIDYVLLTLLSIAILKKKRWVPLPKYIFLFSGVVIFSFFSFFLNLLLNPDFDFIIGLTGLLMFFRMFLTFLIASSVITSIRDYRRFLFGVAAAIWLLLVDSIYFTYFYNHLDRLTAGSLGNNAFGNFLSMSAILLLGIGSISRGSLRYFLGITVGCCMAAVVLTQTKMALFILLTGFVIWYSTLGGNRLLRTKTLAILAGTFGLFIFWINRFESLSRINPLKVFSGETPLLENPYLNTFFSARIHIWKTSLKMISENFFWGIGPNQWNLQKYNYGFSLDHVLLDSHNGYLQIFSEYGIFLFVAFYSIILLSLWNGKRTCQKLMQGNSTKMLVWSTTISLFIWSISELTNAAIIKNRINNFVVILVYILLHAGYLGLETHKSDEKFN